MQDKNELEIKEMKDYARENSVPIMKDAGMDFICDYIKEHKIKNILEIGTAIGYSAIRFASLADDIFVSTIEYDIDRYQQAVKNVSECNLMDRITLYLGDALTTEISGTFDMIFIDGAKAQYTRFFEKFKYQLSQGGVIVTDNLSFHGMVENPDLTHNYSTKKLVHKIRKFIDFLTINEEFTTQYFEVGDRVAISRRNSQPKKDIFEILIDIGIYYELQLHKPIFSEEDSKDIDIQLIGNEVKNLFVKDKHGTYILVSMPLHKRADLKQIAEIFSTTRLSFCNPEELGQYLHIQPGSVTPLCIMYDKLNKVKFLIDQDLQKPCQKEIEAKNFGNALSCGNILIHPLRNDASISISFDDLIKFTEHFGHDYKIVQLNGKD
ncbi:MAG: class I SAM-dependent methyltransferase [Treponemataceae bacterium]|nr:class I SAM-dependent methyltransferase [Treponemataceae bacterium]